MPDTCSLISALLVALAGVATAQPESLTVTVSGPGGAKAIRIDRGIVLQ